MPNITGPSLSFPSRSFPGQQAGAPSGVAGELLLSELLGKYSTLVKSGKVFYTSASVTAPVIFSTAAQLGPMLWNKPGSGIDAHIIGGLVVVGPGSVGYVCAGGTLTSGVFQLGLVWAELNV